MTDRRNFIAGILAAAALPLGPAWAQSTRSNRQILEAELASGNACGRREAALRGTLARLARMRAPASGRAIIVDIPSQSLVAYESGQAVMESRVVVGDPKGWKTPDLETTAAYVRFNPTWTVPESIMTSRNWRGRLAREPRYFSRLNFAVELDGRLVEPEQAAPYAQDVRRFVQRPGKDNALGSVKIGLNAGNAIYLHDTSDPEGFDEDARTLSHGCVRVEKAMDLAAWALGIDVGRAESLLRSDDRTDRKPASAIRVATTYLTAWPDASGQVRYWPDVYDKDRIGSRCNGYDPDEDIGPAPTRREGPPQEFTLED